jgi:predicted  nucleic acid-binding Zn-ribbon protein
MKWTHSLYLGSSFFIALSCISFAQPRSSSSLLFERLDKAQTQKQELEERLGSLQASLDELNALSGKEETLDSIRRQRDRLAAALQKVEGIQARFFSTYSYEASGRGFWENPVKMGATYLLERSAILTYADADYWQDNTLGRRDRWRGYSEEIRIALKFFDEPILNEMGLHTFKVRYRGGDLVPETSSLSGSPKQIQKIFEVFRNFAENPDVSRLREEYRDGKYLPWLLEKIAFFQTHYEPQILNVDIPAILKARSAKLAQFEARIAKVESRQKAEQALFKVRKDSERLRNKIRSLNYNEQKFELELEQLESRRRAIISQIDDLYEPLLDAEIRLQGVRAVMEKSGIMCLAFYRSI